MLKYINIKLLCYYIYKRKVIWINILIILRYDTSYVNKNILLLVWEEFHLESRRLLCFSLIKKILLYIETNQERRWRCVRDIYIKVLDSFSNKRIQYDIR